MKTVSDSASKNNRTSALVGGQPVSGTPGESTEVHTIQLDGVTIRVVRFELGNYELTAQAKRELGAVFPILRGSLQRIMVKGYVAPSEVGEGYQQESDLAFYRAVSVVDHLVSLGLNPDFFDISVAPETLPGRNVLPAGTDPSLAGATAEILLLNKTSR